MALSTEIVHSVDNDDFYGDYVYERSKMDYSYFKNYTKERQMMQNDIIKSILDKKAQKNRPWIIYMCGCYGSGKTHVLKHMSLHNNLFNKIDEYVHIDPDKIKDMLPECNELTKMYPELTGRLLHKEATFIALLTEYIALNNNYPLIIDGSLHDHEWYSEHLKELRQNYKNYKIGIIKIDTELDTVLERCHRRGLETKRIISIDLIKNIYYKIPYSFDILKEYVDMYIELVNNDKIVINKIIINSK